MSSAVDYLKKDGVELFLADLFESLRHDYAKEGAVDTAAFIFATQEFTGRQLAGVRLINVPVRLMASAMLQADVPPAMFRDLLRGTVARVARKSKAVGAGIVIQVAAEHHPQGDEDRCTCGLHLGVRNGVLVLVDHLAYASMQAWVAFEAEGGRTLQTFRSVPPPRRLSDDRESFRDLFPRDLWQ